MTVVLSHPWQQASTEHKIRGNHMSKKIGEVLWDQHFIVDSGILIQSGGWCKARHSDTCLYPSTGERAADGLAWAT